MSRYKPTIKAKRDTIGHFDWTPGSKLHSTIQRLMATFVDDDTPVPAKKRSKIKQVCPYCKRKIVVQKGRFIRHYHYRWFFTFPNSICTNSNKPI